MSRKELSTPPRARGLLILYRILLIFVLALVLVILGGTLYALAIRPKTTAPGVSVVRPSDRPPDRTLVQDASAEAAIFTGLGRLRCPTAGSDPGAVVLTAVFPYHPGDRPFSEELVSRIREFRNITSGYFAALPVEELRRRGESAVKEELLSRYNAVLRLGKIEVLYFNDFMIIE